MVIIMSMACSKSAKEEKTAEVASDSSALVSFPDEVMAIIENKCLGCHKPDSKNEDAKEDLIWEDLPGMKKGELAKIMFEIQEVLEDGEMPPEKMLAKFPDKKLTDEEVATLMAWTETTLAGMGE